VVRLLLERGGDPTVSDYVFWTPLISASCDGHLEVVRLLLGHPSAKTAINQSDTIGETALWKACYFGHGGVARALLERGADPTIADSDGPTLMTIAKHDPPHHGISAEGRRECVTALEVSFCRPRSSLAPAFVTSLLSRRVLSWAWWQEAERAYQLWKARQVADQQGSDAVAVRGEQEGGVREALVGNVVRELKGDLFPDLMELMA
jgi:hypothetical protein